MDAAFAPLTAGALAAEATAAAAAGEAADQTILRFVCSHDPPSLLAASQLCTGCTLEVAFPGSLGGSSRWPRQGGPAGCHLWDAESDTYNVPFVRRLLPGRRVALVTLAHRRLGFIVPPGNPAGLTAVSDLARPGLRFINRQRGAGTRVWLDAQLHAHGLAAGNVAGYTTEVATLRSRACGAAPM